MNNNHSIIRHVVFETNSSSCHSLALAKGEDGELSKLYTDFNLDENGNLHFEVDCYDGSFDVLSSFQSKLSYMMTYVIKNGSHYGFSRLMKALHDVTQFNELYYQDILVGHWDEKTNKFKFSKRYEDVDALNEDISHAYIDSNSFYLLSDIIEDEAKIKTLLFVEESEIVIEHDEHFFQVAGGNKTEVKKQVHNLLSLILPNKIASNPELFNDELVNQFIKVFGRIGLSRKIKDLSVSNKMANTDIIKKSLIDVFSSNDDYGLYKTDAGTLYDLFDLVENLFGKKYRRFNTVKKLVCSAGSISYLYKLLDIPEFMEHVFNDFKNEAIELASPHRPCYDKLEQRMSELSMSKEQTMSSMTEAQKQCFDEFVNLFIKNRGIDRFARKYLVGYLLLNKLKDVPLKKWTKQFSYEYHS